MPLRQYLSYDTDFGLTGTRPGPPKPTREYRDRDRDCAYLNRVESMAWCCCPRARCLGGGGEGAAAQAPSSASGGGASESECCCFLLQQCVADDGVMWPPAKSTQVDRFERRRPWSWPRRIQAAPRGRKRAAGGGAAARAHSKRTQQREAALPSIRCRRRRGSSFAPSRRASRERASRAASSSWGSINEGEAQGRQPLVSSMSLLLGAEPNHYTKKNTSIEFRAPATIRTQNV